MNRIQKYVFVVLVSLFPGETAHAQCLSLPQTSQRKFIEAARIVEGKVVSQQTQLNSDGNIVTSSRVEVYRVFKGNADFSIDVITEGGIFGNTMQMVMPSTQFSVGDYGLIVLNSGQQQGVQNLATSFMPIDEESGRVSATELATDREALYDALAAITGSNIITLKRIPLNSFEPKDGVDAFTSMALEIGRASCRERV